MIDSVGSDDGIVFTFSNASAAAGDTASLALNAANTTDLSGVSIAAIETLNVSATGTNVLGTLTTAAATTVNVAGAGSLSATLASGNITTVNAAENTGGVTLNLAASDANNQTITGGTGNDSITTEYAGLSNQDTINLGDGVDSLIFANGNATFNDATTAARLSNVTNVEKLGIIGNTLTVDGDLVSQNIFTTSGANGDFAITDAANNSTLEFGAGAADASTTAMKLGANTLNVELNGSTAAVANAGNGLTVTGSQTVNLSTNGTAGVGANTLALTAADNQTVVITGSQDLTLTTTAASNVTGFTLNGSAATGKLNITGTNAADTITGGAGADTLNGGGNVAVAEQFTVDFDGAATGADTIAFNGATITLSGGDDAATIAGKVAGGTYTDWTATASNDVVTFVNKATGTVTDVQASDFTITDTGSDGAPSIGSLTTTVQGAAAVAFTADTFTGGEGKDTFIVGTNGAAAASDSDVIMDFATKTDKIDFQALNTAGSATTYAEATAAVADFTSAKTAADTAITGNFVYSAQQVGADTYVFADTNGDSAADSVVKLTGVALDGIEFADIVA